MAPHSGSFKQGCHVRNVHTNGLLRPTVDRKNRLTGRAANQRKPLETNYKDGNSISERSQDFEKMRKEAHFLDRDDRFQDRGYRSNDRYKNKTFMGDESSNSSRDRETFRPPRKVISIAVYATMNLRKPVHEHANCDFMFLYSLTCYFQIFV